MPELVSTKQITQMRSIAARRMKTACTVYPAVEASTSIGGTAKTWPTGTTTVCRIYAGMQSSGRAALSRDEIGDMLYTLAYWTIILPYDTTVGADDKIVVGSQTFRVVGVPDDQSVLVQKNVTCEEIQ
jgi:hypothetical protein